MNLKNTPRIALIALAAAGMMFAGCAKKEVVSNESQAPQQSVQPVKAKAAMPSSNSVYFAFDSSALDAAGKATLDAYAAYLNDHADVAIILEGNCDERGSREYNLALGQRRADSVRDYLNGQGVDASRVDTVSFGEERPVCTGSGEACWAQNRRADIVSR